MAQIEQIMNQFIDNISNKYAIDKTELESMIPLIYEKKKKKITPCNNSIQCLGRKQDGKQCTRKKKEGCDICGKHINNQKDGRVDDNNNEQLTNELLRTVLVNIENNEYLMDGEKNLFTFHPESPEYIGKLINNKIVSCY